MVKRTLFLINKCIITTKNNQLVIQSDKKQSSIPIEDIGYVVVENQETIFTIPSLTKLSENNVAVIFCNKKHMPNSMLLNLESHHLQQELFKNQLNASVPLKKQLWKQTIQEKIKNQALLFEILGKSKNPLNYYASKVLSGDSDNRESAASSYYWKNLFDFKFTRERFGDFPNPILNYGYIVLRAAVARSLSGSGLLNTIGIHHHNRYNAFCLADDIMEPFRPIVDEKVIEIVSKVGETELNTEIKSELLKILTRTVYFKESKSPLMVALSTTTTSLQKCFMGKERKIIYPTLWN